MKIATAAYPLDVLGSWADYAAKLGTWVAEAAAQGADLAVFPEYGAMELATLRGPEVAGDLERSLHAVSEVMGDVADLHADLAARHGLHILGASAPVLDPAIGPRPVNRAILYTPTGARAHQDKQIMTRFEREDWHVAPGGPLRIFDTALGKIGILICYDSEFPLLGRALAEAELLLVPSCTEALTGYWRVRIGAMARALEAQCVSVMASTVGNAAWSPAVETNTGMGGIFGPPDTGFPATGVLAQGTLDTPGWTLGEVDLARVAHVRADGVVLNRRHWDDQAGRDGAAKVTRLR
ncbi:MAG: carbon-nitrogen hydrolase family protein [Roseovarius sp.]|nr:carbon-nitrogen hydrolase family protein [Roseovarius sp.]